jgi:threonine synthase
MAALACDDCSGPLDVEYLRRDEGGEAAHRAAWSDVEARTPLHDPTSAVTLSEGDTPCVELTAAAGLMGLRRLVGKLEFLSPTGSFKDRGTTVMMSVARELGVRELVEDSSGNAGASVSAYAARAGIKAHIFAPAGAPAAKLRQIAAYGAEVHSIEGPRDAATDAAVAYHTEHGLVYASHALSPFFLEGTKTFAYEIARQLEGGLPDHIVFPVGNGGLYLGAWKGFDELRSAGLIGRVPRLHCVQSRTVMPLVAAHHGEEWLPSGDTVTVAGGIAVGAPARRDQVLSVLRATSGAAVAVDDPDILRWQSELAERDGIYAEATSAAALAGLERLVLTGVVGADEMVLVPITGTGLKDTPPG